MKKFVLIAFILFVSSTSWAWELWEPSFYIGAGYGYSRIDTGVSGLTGTASLDDDDNGFKLFGGFKFNKFLGVEAAYAHLGEAELKGSTGDQFSSGGTTYQFLVDDVTIEAEATSIELAVVYFLPLDYFMEPLKPLEPFFKLGAHLWEVEYSMSANNFDQVKSDDDDIDIVWGMGINIKVIDNVAIRAEWERFKTEEDIDFFSASFVFNF